MTIDIHKGIGKLSIIPKRGFNLPNIDIFSKYAYAFAINSKKYQILSHVFEKIFKERKPKMIWSHRESSFFSKEM